MPNLNKVMLMGNLTRDPELRYLPTNNTAVVGLGLAVNRRWRNQQGEQQEETTFVDCEAFGRTAELLNQYLKKGRPVYLEGRLKLDQWQDREGGKRSKLKVIIENFQFIDSRESNSGGGGGGGYQGGNAGGGGGGYAGNRGNGGGNYNNNAPQQNNNAPQQDPHQPVDEDDIPF